MPKGIRYSTEEDEYIISHYHSTLAKDIANQLGRTVKSIRRRAQKIGVLPKKIVRRWTKEENDLLRTRGDKKLKDLAEILGRDMSEVSDHAMKLGVPFRREYRVTPRGYARIQIRNGKGERRTVWQHRNVMETILGRPLKSNEIVHHINCNKLDNTPDNLFLCSSLKEHRQVHTSIEKLIAPLIEKGIIKFDRESATYQLTEE